MSCGVRQQHRPRETRILLSSALEEVVRPLQLPRSTLLALSEQRVSPELRDALLRLAAGKTLSPVASDLVRACGLSAALARGYEIAFSSDPTITRAASAARAWRDADRPRDALRALAAVRTADLEDRDKAMILTPMAGALCDLHELEAARLLAEKAIDLHREMSDYAQRALAAIATKEGRRKEAAARFAQAEHVQRQRTSLAAFATTPNGSHDDAPEYKSFQDAVERRKVRGRKWYTEYLASNGWRERRSLARQAAGQACERCGKRGLLHVHHLTYERVGAEWLSDLEVLCPTCHTQEHDSERIALTSVHAIVGPFTIAGDARCESPALR